MTRGSKEFRRVRKGKNCILLVADAATTNAVLLPYRCHDQYKNDALATAPQDYRIIDTNMCQPYPKAQAHLKTEYSSISTLLTLSSALDILTIV